MNIDRVSPRGYQLAPQHRVTFNPVVQTKTFHNSDPINATRPTIHASRLESVLKTSPSKKALVKNKPEKPPPRPIYQTPETPQKQKGRLMFWCAMGSLALIPAFGPGALVITGICAFVSALYLIQHERLINQSNYHENRTYLAIENGSIGEQPRTDRASGQAPRTMQYRQSPRTHAESRTTASVSSNHTHAHRHKANTQTARRNNA